MPKRKYSKGDKHPGEIIVHTFYANVVSPYSSVVIPSEETNSLKNVVCSANYGSPGAAVHKQPIKPRQNLPSTLSDLSDRPF